MGFTFWSDNDECSTFDGEQRNGRPFRLEMEVDDSGKPVGVTWTMPAEYPKFRLHFGDHERAILSLAVFKWEMNTKSSFGRFKNRMNSERRRSVRSSFMTWRNNANQERVRLRDSHVLEV